MLQLLITEIFELWKQENIPEYRNKVSFPTLQYLWFNVWNPLFVTLVFSSKWYYRKGSEEQ